MTTESTRRPLREAAGPLSAMLVIVAIVLGVLVWRAAAEGPTVRIEPGERMALRTEPYGRQVTVRVPGSEVTVLVGDPVPRLDWQLIDAPYDDPRWEEQPDLAAEDDGLLVPLAWSIESLDGFATQDDPAPIVLRLVAGAREVALIRSVIDSGSAAVDASDPTAYAVAVDGGTDPDDLAIEVEYDGLTQTADVVSGEVDSGAAQALYDDRDYTAGCTEVDDECAIRAVDPDSPVQPYTDTFIASWVSLYPYDAALGWADEGTLWAAVRLQLFGADGVRDAGDGYWATSRQSRPVVTLDGEQPVRREGLQASRFDTVGRVVFRVDADADPAELVVEQTVTTSGAGAPAPLPTRAVLALTRVD